MNTHPTDQHAPRFRRSAARRAARALALATVALAPVACSNESSQAPKGRELVIIKGERFYLEPALDAHTREVGLGGRETIDPHGGMIFVFPKPKPESFWMRNCLTDIDIAYLSETGRVMTMYEMKAEPPKKPGESDIAYFNRLKRYPSEFPSRFVIEVAPGTWKRLDLKPGDVVSFDIEDLKVRAR